MEEVFKQIASIKEEYACTAKELQLEVKSTTSIRESEAELLELTFQLAERADFDANELCTVKMQLYDAIARKRMLEIELEDKKAAKTALLKELEFEANKQLELTKEIKNQTSPDDYTQNVQDIKTQVQALKKEVQQETMTRSTLTEKLVSLERATTRLTSLKPEIDRLRKAKITLLSEMAAIELSQSNTTALKSNAHQLQQDLKEAQERYHYLCAHLEVIQ